MGQKPNYKLREKTIRFIRDYIDEHEYSPTIREILKGIKEYKAVSHVDSSLTAMEKAGVLTRDKGKSRTIKLVGYGKDNIIAAQKLIIEEQRKTIEEYENKIRLQRTFTR